MIKKIVFCLILLCCMSSVAFAENPSDNVNETTTNDDIDILKIIDYEVKVYDDYYGLAGPTSIERGLFVNYTDAYIVDAETGKYIPLGEVTKPLPQYMVMRDDTARHNGWGLTYEDIMFGSNVPEHSLVNYTSPYKEIMVYTEQNPMEQKPADLNIDYTDTYTIDCETGKFIPLGEVTKPLPENMVMYDDQGVSHTGCGLTYEDIMNYNYKIHPLNIFMSHTEQNIDYTDTYTIDCETGKFIPLGEVTKPLPENMILHAKVDIHTGCGLTYEDIMNHNTQIHPLK